MFKALLVASLAGVINAECPNGCSSHGRCTAYDMCLCYRNWMANDCSERICQFGLAHVDTPKGDLDASSGALTGPGVDIAMYSEMYPAGTQEQFPKMETSVGTVLSDTAHYYMECSNKGLCDRETGTCECFPGYEGSACQRASCPSTGGEVCSGHGTCQSIKQIAEWDSGNIYELWDEKATLGCVCDAGYYGADCALRECKYGADPLYYDDNANIRYSNWTIIFATEGAATLSGQYAIKFFDHFGEDWETTPIDAGATCAEIITALEDIPNDVIPDGSVRCRKFESSEYNNPAFYTGYPFTIQDKYILMFHDNPGYLKEIQVNRYLDGARPTLVSNEVSSTLEVFVYADGFTGEDIDLVPDECENVLVSFSQLTNPTLFGSITNAYVLHFSNQAVMEPLLKRCLGDADNDKTFEGMANEVFNWDYGTEQNPHLVKFIDATEDMESLVCKSVNDYAWKDGTHLAGWCFERAPAGFYAPVIYRETLGVGYFGVYSNAPDDYASTTEFRVFTTTGYLNKVSYDAEVFTKSADWSEFYPNTVYTANRGFDANNAILDYSPPLPYRYNQTWNGHIDCETYTVRNITKEDCLSKGDYVMFFSTENTDTNYLQNPKYHNMYRVKKISIEYPRRNTPGDAREDIYRNQIVLDVHANFLAPLSTSAVASAYEDDVRFRAYKFYPPTPATRYVDECSGRGLCNAKEGLCECFAGYTNDDCSVQNAASM